MKLFEFGFESTNDLSLNLFHPILKLGNKIKLFVIIISSLFILGCSQKSVINKPYLDTQNKIQKMLEERHLKLNNITNENINNSSLKLKESQMPTHHVISDSSSYWYIFEGRPFDKQDVLMPKYTTISIQLKTPKKTLIKIDSFDQGLLFRSRDNYRQIDWLNQIINSFN